MMIRSFNGKTPQIAESAFVSEAAYVVGDVEIGENSSVWPGAVIRGDFGQIKIGQNTQVEDNCVTLIEFENRAIAINETAFVSWGGAYSVEIDGTEGGFWMLGPQEVRVRGKAFGGDRTWHSVDELPPRGTMPIPQWIAAIQGRGEIEFGMTAAVQLTELMEAAYRSYYENRTVPLSEVTG